MYIPISVAKVSPENNNPLQCLSSEKRSLPAGKYRTIKRLGKKTHVFLPGESNIHSEQSKPGQSQKFEG
jgi:hypothetical protein